MKLGVATSKAKSKYGPIADAIQKTGMVDILTLEDQSKWNEYDYIIVFYNKIPTITNRPKKRIAWWMNDLRLPNELNQLKEYNFDDIFLCHKTYDESFKHFFNKPLYYMPQCGHSHPLVKGRNINWDVSFIGKTEGKRFYHRDRSGLLEEIGKNFRLGIITGEGQTADQCWIYNQSKYNLSVSFPMVGGTSNRLYNILASGGFALVRYFPELEKMFENKKHLVWFKNVKEAIELIKYYNNHEEERVLIAKQGHEQYLKEHTAQRRLNNMFNIMQGKETNFKGYL